MHFLDLNENELTKYTSFTLMGVKERKEGQDVVRTYPVDPQDAKYFALECVGTDGYGIFVELDEDVLPEVWRDVIGNKLEMAFADSTQIQPYTFEAIL